MSTAGLEKITVADASDYPEEWFVQAGLWLPRLGYVLPYGLEDTHPELFPSLRVVVLGDEGARSTHRITVHRNIPRLRMLGETRSENELWVPRTAAAFRHRKGESPSWEPRARLLGLVAYNDPNTGAPPTGFYYGEHPDHPGQEGLYIHALHVGDVSLRSFETGIQEDPQGVDGDAQIKFFPIGRAAELARPV